VCRCYGSTFGIVLPETLKETAIAVGRKLKGLVEQNPIIVPEAATKEPLTLSMGVCTFLEDAETIDAFLDEAKQALDEAEKQGGNRIITA